MPDEDEFLNIKMIPMNKAVELVLNNMLPDAKSQAAILKLDALLRSGKI
jgi:ADP-ribose pyrophosphatase